VIVTVTPNPSIDRTLSVPALRRGEIVRVTATRSEAGGKGINVSCALAQMGVPTTAIAPASRTSQAQLTALLAGERGNPVELRTVAIDGEIRVNVSIVEPDGTVTKVNEPGPALEAGVAARLLDDLVIEAADAFAQAAVGGARRNGASSVRWLVGCGSLPPGVPPAFYATLAARMPDDIRVAVDADRAALREAAGPRVALVKPNRAELEELVGRSLGTLGEVIEAARELVGAGIEQVLVSLGVDGAVIVSRSEVRHAEARLDDLGNPVGAGDALLAGFLAGGATAEGLPEAIAWSVAACRASGTRMPAVTDRDRQAVVVHGQADLGRVLVG
jgi:1-phosphofructokinase